MLRASVLSGPRLFSELEGRWTDLVQHSPSATPFQTPEFQSLWFKHYGRGRRTDAVLVEDGRDLVGLMTFATYSGAWKTLRPLGMGPSDYLHPVARAGYEDHVAEIVAEQALSSKGIDLVDLHQVRETQPLVEHFDAKEEVFEEARCLVLDLPPTYDAYLSMLGKSLRYDVRSLDKKYNGEKGFVERTTPENVTQHMAAFLDLHSKRWKSRGQWWGGAFVGPATRFHQEWASTAVNKGWLRMSHLIVEGRSVGAIYGMGFGRVTYFYQSGFDPEFKAASPGTVLVASTIRDAIQEGKSAFDFMRGAEPYKKRWKPQHEFCNLRLLKAITPMQGRLGQAWNLKASDVEVRVRARLEGKSLR